MAAAPRCSCCGTALSPQPAVEFGWSCPAGCGDQVVQPKPVRLKWLDRSNADRSNKNEIRLAKQLGGKRLPRSGGKLWSRNDKSSLGSTVLTDGGDLATADFHLENKRTEKKSMSFQREWLEKVTDGARRVGKYPGVIVTFDIPQKLPQDWVMVPIKVFEVLQNLLKKAKDGT